jgi:hypothetical protein
MHARAFSPCTEEHSLILAWNKPNITNKPYTKVPKISFDDIQSFSFGYFYDIMRTTTWSNE